MRPWYAAGMLILTARSNLFRARVALCALGATATAASCAHSAIDSSEPVAFADDAGIILLPTPPDGSVARDAAIDSEPFTMAPPTPDAGPTDAATAAPDAGPRDAGTLPTDVPLPDTGARDGGADVPVDAGAARDAGTDAGANDGSTRDAGGGAATEAGSGGDGGVAEGCVPGANADGDGISDCDELGDGDPFTDPQSFNGVRVQLATHCTNLALCSDNDTRPEVAACMAVAEAEHRDQYAGWDWADGADSNCSASYGFAPPFGLCSTTWQARSTGTIHLSAGTHCFEITGTAIGGCASLFFDADAIAAQTGTGARCYDRTAGDYPIMWHYNMTRGAISSVHLRYCFGGQGPCTPSAILPARMLRPAP